MIELQNLKVVLGEKEIFSNLSSYFMQGEFSCIVGTNGAGKTTLIRSILGIIPIKNGKILIDNKELYSLSPKERALKIAYLPQTQKLLTMTAQDLVLRGRYPHLGLFENFSQKDKNIVENAMEKTGTLAFKNRVLSSLSGGELQRVRIAMTLAQESSHLFFDEPTAALDIRHQLEILSILKQLSRENKAVVAVLHDLQQAFLYADKVFLLDKGNLSLCIGEQGLKKLSEAFNIAFAKDERQDSLYPLKLIKNKNQ